jgi:dATP pyrophosphohydrolase
MVYCFAARPSADGRSHEFLQLRRCAGDFMGGTWQPVCGRIEAGEKAWEAAVRELREETGLVAREFYVIEFVNSFYIPAQDTMWHCANFLAVVNRDAPITLNHEHDAHRWVGADEVEQKFMWPGDRRAIEEATRQVLQGEGGARKTFQRIAL